MSEQLDTMFADMVVALRPIGYGRMMQIISYQWRADLMNDYGTETGAFEGTPVGAYDAAIARVARLEAALKEINSNVVWYAEDGVELLTHGEVIEIARAALEPQS